MQFLRSYVATSADVNSLANRMGMYRRHRGNYPKLNNNSGRSNAFHELVFGEIRFSFLQFAQIIRMYRYLLFSGVPDSSDFVVSRISLSGSLDAITELLPRLPTNDQIYLV